MEAESSSLSYSVEELPEVASQLLKAAGSERIWLFDAAMGAGKTTLIKQLALHLKVQDNVSSPTFGIVNEYLDGQGKSIYHFDCYRLKDEEEALDIGIEEYFESGAYCWIEWPTQIEGLLPEHFFYIQINITSENTRQLTYQVI